ncbi:MAG: tRNA 2-selenouridine(34) synthase MnmH [Pseudomonadota bacterium]
MALHLHDLRALAAASFDTVIDVRAPGEFAQDHVPGAINLPVLSDAERAEVGTIYTQVDRFEARKRGAALVARNAAAHLDGPLRDKPGGWQPLVYCWRGGQRSGSFASILAQIGWRVEVLAGGYKSYRRCVVGMLHDGALPFSCVLVDGFTGTAKTDILARLHARGHQVLDLEALAAHRGSIFGATVARQPSQKGFESRIAMALSGMDPHRPLILEAESSKIGARLIPPALWAAMRAAPRVEITASPEARVEYLLRTYGDVAADPMRLDALLAGLVPLHGHERVADWQIKARAGALRALVAALIATHYDPRYARSRRGRDAARQVVRAADLSPAGIAAAAVEVEHALARLRPAVAVG